MDIFLRFNPHQQQITTKKSGVSSNRLIPPPQKKKKNRKLKKKPSANFADVAGENRWPLLGDHHDLRSTQSAGCRAEGLGGAAAPQALLGETASNAWGWRGGMAWSLYIKHPQKTKKKKVFQGLKRMAEALEPVKRLEKPSRRTMDDDGRF